MKTPKEILDKHINAFYETDKMAVFEDIPMKVFHDAMEDFAEEKVKNLALPHVIIALPEFGVVEMATWDYFTTQGQHGEITNEEHYHIVMEYLKNNIAFIQGCKGNEL